MESRKNNKKKSLIMSIMSIVLCLAMLAGATFAWFSDSVTGHNLIQTGNLDVVLKHLKGDQLVEVDNNTQLFLNAEEQPILWEPGAMAVETFVIENQGTLSLNYELALSAAEEGITIQDEEGNDVTYKLWDRMKVGILQATINADGSVTPAVSDAESVKTAILTASTVSSHLEAGTNDGDGHLTGNVPKVAYTVVVYWDPVLNNSVVKADNIDNVFNRPGGYKMNLSINLNATQRSSEKDVFGSGYDETLLPETDEGNIDDPLA